MKSKSKLALGFGILAIACTAIGLTVAFSFDTSIFGNDFNVSKYEVEYNEEFTSPTNWTTCETAPKTFVITNKSDVPIGVRVKAKGTWVSSENATLSGFSSSPRLEMAVIEYANTTDWVKKKIEGVEYYVYNSDLQPGESTSTFLTGVTLNCEADLGKDRDYNGATYNLKLTAQTIQANRKAEVWQSRTTWPPVGYIFTDSVTREKCGISEQSSFDPKQFHCIKRFEKSETSPVGVIQNSSIRTTEGSGTNDYPILMWLDEEEMVLHWYTEADVVYMPASSYGLFANLNKLETLDGFEDFDTSEVITMYDMCYNCTSLRDVSAVANWNTSRVTSTRYAFANTMLESLEPFRNWDMHLVQDSAKMFSQHEKNYSVTSAEPLAGWDISSSTDVSGMFWNFENLDASSLDNWTLNSGAPHSFDMQLFACSATIPSWYTYSRNCN